MVDTDMVLAWGNVTGLYLRLHSCSAKKLHVFHLQVNVGVGCQSACLCVHCGAVLVLYLDPLCAYHVHTNTHCTVTGCGMCLNSDFFDLWRSCGDCNITNTEPQCQLSCGNCLAGEGVDTTRTPAPFADQQLAIPALGCSVNRRNFQLACRPQSEGSCGETWSWLT